MVAGADGAELFRGRVKERALRLEGGVADLVDDGMVDRLVVLAADAEADAIHDRVHDHRDVVAQVGDKDVGADGLVAAADVEADSAGADVVAIGDDATDGLRVANVPVGADGGRDRVAGGRAPSELLDRARINVATDRDGRRRHRPHDRIRARCCATLAASRRSLVHPVTALSAAPPYSSAARQQYQATTDR